jgi:apolipoprotein N-acyltransferase
VLDFAPLRQLATFFGIASITFVTVFLCTWAAMMVPQANVGSTVSVTALKLQTEMWKLLPHIAFALLILFTITGFIIISGQFYQVNVNQLVINSIPVSCIFSQNAVLNSVTRSEVWNMTRTRAAAGDKIILWAEEAFSVSSTEDESNILAQAQVLATTYDAYIGVAYMMQLPGESMATNQFALIASDGDLAWNYLKAHPVPGVENSKSKYPH